MQSIVCTVAFATCKMELSINVNALKRHHYYYYPLREFVKDLQRSKDFHRWDSAVYIETAGQMQLHTSSDFWILIFEWIKIIV